MFSSPTRATLHFLMCWEVNNFWTLAPCISRSTSLPWSPSTSAKLSSMSVVLQSESRNAITCRFPVPTKTTSESTSTNARPSVSWPEYTDWWCCRYCGSTAWFGCGLMSSCGVVGTLFLSISVAVSDLRFAFARSINLKNKLTLYTRVWWPVSQLRALHLLLL